MGRFVVGMGVAISAVADVSYLAEVAPRGLRGAMVSTNELAISLGMLGAFLAGRVFRDVSGENFILKSKKNTGRNQPVHRALMLP